MDCHNQSCLQYFQEILKVESGEKINPEEIPERDRHYLYQVIIQHGLQGDNDDLDSSTVTMEKTDSLLNKDELKIAADLIFLNFGKILEIIVFELMHYHSNRVHNHATDMELVKESLSSLSYLFSGLWVSEKIMRRMKENSTRKILTSLFPQITKSCYQNLQQSLLFIENMNNSELNLILLFLFSKQQVSIFFERHYKEWLEFFYKWIINAKNKTIKNNNSEDFFGPFDLVKNQQMNLYQNNQRQQQTSSSSSSIFSFPSQEIIHSLESIEKFFIHYSEEKDSFLQRQQQALHPSAGPILFSIHQQIHHFIPENIIQFLLTQFFLIDPLIVFSSSSSFQKQQHQEEEREQGIEGKSMEKSVEVEELSTILTDEMRQIFFRIISYLDGNLLKSFFPIILNKFPPIATKLCELFNQKELISKKHLKFAQNLWKLWIHLILTSLRPFHQPSSSSPLPTAQAPAAAVTAVLYTTPTKKNDPVSYANFSQQYEQIKRQQLKLKELLEKLADEEKKLQKSIHNNNNNNINGGNGKDNNNNNHINPNQTMQIICKLVLNEIISPVNGIGILVSCLPPLVKISKKLAADCYFHLTKYLVTFQSWYLPNGPLKLIFRCLHGFLLQPPLKKKLFANLPPSTDLQEPQQQSPAITVENVAPAKDYLQSVRIASNILILFLDAMKSLDGDSLDEIRKISVTARSSAGGNTTATMSRMSTKNNQSQLPAANNNSNNPGNNSQLTMIGLFRGYFQLFYDLMSIACEDANATKNKSTGSSLEKKLTTEFDLLLQYERFLFILQASHLIFLQKSMYFQLFHDLHHRLIDPNNIGQAGSVYYLNYPTLPEDVSPSQLSSPASSRLSLSISGSFQKVFEKGLFGFHQIFLKKQLFEQFQLQQQQQEQQGRGNSSALDNLLLLANHNLFFSLFPAPSLDQKNEEKQKEKEKEDDDDQQQTHSLREELFQFHSFFHHFLGNSFFDANFLSSSRFSQLFSTSPKSFLSQWKEIISNYLRYHWEMSIYLITHSLFYELYRFHLRQLHQQQQQQNGGHRPLFSGDFPPPPPPQQQQNQAPLAGGGAGRHSEGEHTHLEDDFPSSTLTTPAGMPRLLPSLHNQKNQPLPPPSPSQSSASYLSQQQRQHQQRQLLSSLTPIYQSTQISVPFTHPGPATHPKNSLPFMTSSVPASSPSFLFAQKNQSIANHNKNNNMTSPAPLSSSSAGSTAARQYYEQILLTSSSSNSSLPMFVNWLILIESIQMITRLLALLPSLISSTDTRKIRPSPFSLLFTADSDHEAQKELEQSLQELIWMIVENFIWFCHRTNGFHWQLGDLMNSFDQLSASDQEMYRDIQQKIFDDHRFPQSINPRELLKELLVDLFSFTLIKKKKDDDISNNEISWFASFFSSSANIKKLTLVEFIFSLFFYLNKSFPRRSPSSNIDIDEDGLDNEEEDDDAAAGSMILVLALKRSMNSFIESGALPILYAFLPRLVEGFHHLDLPIPSKLSTHQRNQLLLVPHDPAQSISWPDLSVILNEFLKETFSKLSQMMAPSFSEENSCELMLTMTNGLKRIVTIPLQFILFGQFSSLFDLFFRISFENDPSAATTTSSSSTVEAGGEISREKVMRVVELESFAHFVTLFRLYLQLEDICTSRQYSLDEGDDIDNDGDDHDNEEENSDEEFPLDRSTSSLIRLNPFQFLKPVDSKPSTASRTPPPSQSTSHLSPSASSLRWELPILRSFLPRPSPPLPSPADLEEEQSIIFIEELQKAFYFLEKLYLIVLEYSLLYTQQQRAIHNNQNQKDNVVYSLIAMKSFSFLFSAGLSILVALAMKVQETTEGIRNNILCEYPKQFKEYLSFVMKLLKEFFKILPNHLLLELKKKNTNTETNTNKNGDTTLFFLAAFSVFPSNSPAAAAAAAAAADQEGGEGEGEVEEMNIFQVLIGLLISLLLSLPSDEKESVHRELSSFLWEKILFLEESLALYQPQLLQRSSSSSSPRLPLRQRIHSYATSCLWVHRHLLFPGLLTLDDLTARLTALLDKDSSSSTSLRRQMTIQPPTVPTTTAQEHGNEDDDDEEEGEGEEQDPPASSRQNSNKRKYIEVADSSHLQTIIETAAKKQIKQGIIPIFYNSQLEARQALDQQSQDNHCFSLSSQLVPPPPQALAQALLGAAEDPNSQASQVARRLFASQQLPSEQSVSFLPPAPLSAPVLVNIPDPSYQPPPLPLPADPEHNPLPLPTPVPSGPSPSSPGSDPIAGLLGEIQRDYQSLLQSSAHQDGELMYRLVEKSQQLQLQFVSLLLSRQQHQQLQQRSMTTSEELGEENQENLDD